MSHDTRILGHGMSAWQGGGGVRYYSDDGTSLPRGSAIVTALRFSYYQRSVSDLYHRNMSLSLAPLQRHDTAQFSLQKRGLKCDILR